MFLWSYPSIWPLLLPPTPHTHTHSTAHCGFMECYTFSAITDSGTNSSWVELTALAAMCAQLTGPNGTEVQVSEAIHISIPLPSDSPLKTATSVPVWRFEERTGKQHLTKYGYIWTLVYGQFYPSYINQTSNFVTNVIRRVITDAHFRGHHVLFMHPFC